MSRTAAPVGEVMMPMRFGRRGGTRLRSVSNSPSSASFALSRSNSPLQRSLTGVLEVIHDHLKVAARFIQADAAPNQDLLTVFGSDSGQHIALAEHGAAQLGAGVLEGKIPVAGSGGGQNWRFPPPATGRESPGPEACGPRDLGAKPCKCRDCLRPTRWFLQALPWSDHTSVYRGRRAR